MKKKKFIWANEDTVPIDSPNGIVNIIYFRINEELLKEQINPLMDELYKSNNTIFKALKVIFGRRVSNETTVSQK